VTIKTDRAENTHAREIIQQLSCKCNVTWTTDGKTETREGIREDRYRRHTWGQFCQSL